MIVVKMRINHIAHGMTREPFRCLLEIPGRLRRHEWIHHQCGIAQIDNSGVANGITTVGGYRCVYPVAKLLYCKVS